jgi:hypothetical protein
MLISIAGSVTGPDSGGDCDGIIAKIYKINNIKTTHCSVLIRNQSLFIRHTL